MVERLVANEKVASSTLVTRSSPESFRGWSECAVARRGRTAQKPRLRKVLESATLGPDWRNARAIRTMHQWRKLAEPRWLNAHENILQTRARGRLVIISRPGRKRLQVEIACTSRDLSRKLIEEFGGRAEKFFF